MSAYYETAEHSWISTLGFCTRAAVGDVGIILGIYAPGALAAGDPGWGLRGRWNIYATATVLGLTYAVLVEHAAGRRALVLYGAHARGARAWRRSAVATPNDAAAFAHVPDCQEVGRAQCNQRRTFMMNHTDGWLGGLAGGGMWIWTAIGVLVVVLLVVVINKLSKKKSYVQNPTLESTI